MVLYEIGVVTTFCIAIFTPIVIGAGKFFGPMPAPTHFPYIRSIYHYYMHGLVKILNGASLAVSFAVPTGAVAKSTIPPVTSSNQILASLTTNSSTRRQMPPPQVEIQSSAVLSPPVYRRSPSVLNSTPTPGGE
jgi:hypothetical protein